MKRYYDPTYNRLVYIGEASTAAFWDTQWSGFDIQKQVTRVRDGMWVEQVTKKYLAPGATILEGGCGTGHYVHALNRWGFRASGVDIAEETVKRVRDVFPMLDIQVGDVQKLPFADDVFDGYWSFGVIEHFYTGYESILSEMARVVKPGGYVFITFPHMSALRRWKAQHGRFSVWSDTSVDRAAFYQFAFDEDRVIEDAKAYGFHLVEKKHLDGVKGMKDEMNHGKQLLQWVYSGEGIVARILKKITGILISRWTSHSVLLVCQKQY